MHGYSFQDFEDEDGIQDVISPHSFNQFLISNAPRTRKCVKKRNKSMDALIVMSKQFDFTRKSKGSVSVAKNTEFIEEKRCNHRINGRIAINSSDEAPVDELS